jgi:hypothetical protein
MKKNTTGYTFIEVMLAVLILAIGIIGVLFSYGNALYAVGRGQSLIDSVNCLKKELAAVNEEIISEGGISLGISTGECQGSYGLVKLERMIEAGPIEGVSSVVISADINSEKRSIATYVKNEDGD